jgi:hypothetical protein
MRGPDLALNLQLLLIPNKACYLLLLKGLRLAQSSNHIGWHTERDLVQTLTLSY